MNEQVAEVLLQKAATLITENVELNVQIRRALAVNETISAINGRIDSIQVAVQKMEKGVQLDESRLRQLEEQSETIKEGFRAFKETAQALNTAVERLDGKVGELQLEETTRWEKNGMVIDRLKWQVPVMWIIHLVTVAVLVGIFIVMKFH
jgi:predicted transcriptional regulator